MPLGFRRAFSLVCVALSGYILIVTYTGIGFPTFSSRNPGHDVAKLQDYDEKPQLTMAQPNSGFRDYLRNDTNYITSWAAAGYSNQFMNHVNMIYLGLLSNRIPIIAPFAPHPHIGVQEEPLPFGDIYDLAYLREKLQIPILEWRDIKILKNLSNLTSGDPNDSVVEEIGCWTTVAENKKGVPEPEQLVRHLGVDVSYTRLPLSVRLPSSAVENQDFVTFPHLAAVIYPEDPLIRSDVLKVFQPSNQRKHQRTPDTQLSCFDSLYYMSSGVRPFEWEKSWSPPWNTVGKHLFYTQKLKQLGEEYVRRAFGIQGSIGSIPPFIAIHIRHGDFGNHCSSSGKTAANCFPPVSTYVKHVDSIKKKWLERSNLTVNNVIVMSDERSADFWDDVKRQGWSFTNHTEAKTVERFNGWYPTIVDTVIQSLAVGHVGTTASTFTLLGERRVRDWNKGFAIHISIMTGT